MSLTSGRKVIRPVLKSLPCAIALLAGSTCLALDDFPPMHPSHRPLVILSQQIEPIEGGTAGAPATSSRSSPSGTVDAEGEPGSAGRFFPAARHLFSSRSQPPSSHSSSGQARAGSTGVLRTAFAELWGNSEDEAAAAREPGLILPPAPVPSTCPCDASFDQGPQVQQVTPRDPASPRPGRFTALREFFTR